MHDNLPDHIYPSDDEPSPPRTPTIPYATLTDDQSNSANRRTTDIQTSTGATTPTLYDIRVATHHDESADYDSIDSNDTHDPPGADETDPPDATPQTTKSHNPHHPNERTQ